MDKTGFQLTNLPKVIGRTIVLTVEHVPVVILMSVLTLFIMGSLPPSASKVSDYHDLKAAIEAAHQARTDLLSNSTGTAYLHLKKEESTPGTAKKMEEMFAKEFGMDPQGFRMSGEGKWTTTWYQKGNKIRYDMRAEQPMKKDSQRPFIIPMNMRVAVDPEKGIYYDILNKHAYIHRPPSPAGNPYNLKRYFRISRFYKFNGDDVHRLLDRCDKAKIIPKISEDLLGHIQCIKLHFSHEKTLPSGKKDRGELLLWVAPEQSYSLVKGLLRGNWGGKYDHLVTIESYDATYEESNDFEGTWLLKEIKIVDNQGHQGAMSEILTATFEDAKIGVDISDETFTFEGLGVPPGTKISDKSLPGQPLQYYYRSFPAGEVDALADEILNQDDKDEGELGRTAGKTVVGESVASSSPDQGQAESEPIVRTVAEVPRGTVGGSYLWLLYGVAGISVGAILVVVVYRIYLRRKGLSTIAEPLDDQ